MKFYRPTFVLGALQPPQDRLRSKLGGLPWGLPGERWPICASCGRPTSLVAQLEHQPPMLDLGSQGGVLHLFCCADVGCRAYGEGGCPVLILRSTEIGEGLTRPPGHWGHETTINGELLLVGWENHDDGVPAELAPLFLDDASHLDLPDETAQPFDFSPLWRTKSGGVPYWSGNGVTLDPSRVPCPPFEFLLQIHQQVQVEGEPPSPDVIVGAVSTYREIAGRREWQHAYPSPGADRGPVGVVHEVGADGYGVDFVNFGSDGTAFVFIDRSADPARLQWHWSR